MHSATRYHDISCGHRVVGHEGKCKNLHGHNYRIWFTVEGQEGSKDMIGRVLDFSEIKDRLCMWLERHWDHKFLVWANDPQVKELMGLDPEGVIITSFNPTAENMAEFLVEMVGPQQLNGTGIQLVCVVVEETRKCSARYEVVR